jgi:hypothetical protein
MEKYRTSCLMHFADRIARTKTWNQTPILLKVYVIWNSSTHHRTPCFTHSGIDKVFSGNRHHPREVFLVSRQGQIEASNRWAALLAAAACLARRVRRINSGSSRPAGNLKLRADLARVAPGSFRAARPPRSGRGINTIRANPQAPSAGALGNVVYVCQSRAAAS